jgi:hypothetical protein
LLPDDPILRQSTEQHFLVHLPAREFHRRLNDPDVTSCLDLVNTHEEFAMTLIHQMDASRIRKVAIHGDTKLDNFLFDSTTGEVRALVDLDTILPHSWLADWGDMVRSLCNIAGEKTRDLDSVEVDREVYESLCRGFLSTAQQITPEEVGLMVQAVEIISLELGLRFLTDYLRGDNYFRLTPTENPDLNKLRAQVQLKLFEKLREEHAINGQIVEKFARA